jgi:hypothetical protein
MYSSGRLKEQRKVSRGGAVSQLLQPLRLHCTRRRHRLGTFPLHQHRWWLPPSSSLGESLAPRRFALSFDVFSAAGAFVFREGRLFSGLERTSSLESIRRLPSFKVQILRQTGTQLLHPDCDFRMRDLHHRHWMH